MHDEVVGWFCEAGFTVASTCIMHSDLTDREQREQMDRFEDDTDGRGVKLMFSVNMLNEGVHVPNVNAVLMLRTTSSRIIYLQQMGRCLTAANTEKPLVLDMVDNITTTTAIKGLLDEFEILEHETADSEGREPRKFEVIDYTLGVKDLMEKLVPESQERIPYEERIAMATAFCEKHGRVPGKRDDKQERRNWAILITYYKNVREVQELIGRFGRPTFEERLARTTEFCEKHGHTPGVNDDKEEARNWWNLLARNGKRPEVQALRNQYGKPMSKSYEERLAQARAFCEKHGRVPKSRAKEEKEEYANWGVLLGAHRQQPEVQALIEQYGRVVVSYEERLRRTTAFCERHNRLPNSKTEKEEYNNWKNLLATYKDRREVQALRDRYEKKQMTFEERIAMATTFCKKHGRVPAKTEDGKDKNNWHYLLVHYGDNPKVIKLRDDYGKIVAILSYEERLAKAMAFCEEHGRSPKTKDNKADYDNWRMLLGSYRDRQEVIALREQYGNRVALSFEERLAQATAFCEANNRLPLRQDGKRELYNWKILVNSYGDQQEVQTLQERYRRLVTFEERLAQATDFCESHGRAPRTKGEDEDYKNWERLLTMYGKRKEVLELRRKYGKKK
jgi:hypothetical protein